MPETDAIFDHLRTVHATAKTEPETLRISLDTKAKVKVGPFSRGGLARGSKAVRAADHDMKPDAILAPAGILEIDSDQVNLIFGTSRDTSDFVADALDLWWADRQAVYPNVRRLLINLDNGPVVGSSRTQFLNRLVRFSDRHRLTLELAYYPSYRSKYNRIERCWGILENHWNGALLSTIATTLRVGKDHDVARHSTACASAGSGVSDGREAQESHLPSGGRTVGAIGNASKVEPGDSPGQRVDHFPLAALFTLGMDSDDTRIHRFAVSRIPPPD